MTATASVVRARGLRAPRAAIGRVTRPVAAISPKAIAGASPPSSTMTLLSTSSGPGSTDHGAPVWPAW